MAKHRKRVPIHGLLCPLAPPPLCLSLSLSSSSPSRFRPHRFSPRALVATFLRHGGDVSGYINVYVLFLSLPLSPSFLLLVSPLPRVSSPRSLRSCYSDTIATSWAPFPRIGGWSSPRRRSAPFIALYRALASRLSRTRREMNFEIR